jgi:predicted dehydrogenase
LAEADLAGALVGFGNVARHGHLPGWRERQADCRIVAVTDLRPERREGLADLLPGARWYASLDALLAAETPDFVDICTPPAMHADAIVQALDRGCHVLCEKPLISRLADLPALLKRAESQRRVVHCVHNWLHAAPIRQLAKLLREAAIGDLRHLSWRTIRNQPAVTVAADAGNWRTDPAIAGGGILVDHGWHALYAVCALVGATPRAIRAVLESRRNPSPALEDTATVELQFDRANASIFLTWAGDGRDNVVAAVGSEGALRLRDRVIVLDRAAGCRSSRRWAFESGLTAGSHHPDWFGGVADAFLAAMRSGQGAGAGNLGEAVLCAYLIERARESDRIGGKTLPVDFAGLSFAA